jgi:hypothetical protein
VIQVTARPRAIVEFFYTDRLLPIDPKTALPAGDGFSFEPDHSPRSFLVADETGIWYGAYPGGNGVRPDRLARIDPTTGDITEYMQLTRGSIAASILDGSLWALNYDGTVTRIDLFAEESASPSSEATASPEPRAPTSTPSPSPVANVVSAHP